MRKLLFACIAILALAGGTALFGAAQTAGASGFLAAYLAGLILGSHRHRATQVINQAAVLLGVDSPPLRNAIEALLHAADIVAAHRTSGASDRLIALAPFARAESGLAGRLGGLANAAAQSRAGQVFQALNWSAAFS